MLGKFVTSKAGHDKGHLYVIVKEDDEYVFLSDGRLKTIECPKKKRKKHVQWIHKHISEFISVEKEETVFQNEQIKRAIKLYAQQRNQSGSAK